MDNEWIGTLLQVVFYGFLAGVLIFFISFFGIIGYRAGDGIVSFISGSSSSSENF